MKVTFLRPSYFVWMIAWMGLFAAYQLFGLPHILWSYDLPRRCTYLGVSGRVSIYFPRDGRCAWILFRQANGRAAQ